MAGVVLKDQVIIEAEVGALEFHFVRVDRLSVERISKVLAQEFKQLSVFLLHPADIWVKHDLFLIYCGLGLHICLDFFKGSTSEWGDII